MSGSTQEVQSGVFEIRKHLANILCGITKGRHSHLRSLMMETFRIENHTETTGARLQTTTRRSGRSGTDGMSSSSDRSLARSLACSFDQSIDTQFLNVQRPRRGMHKRVNQERRYPARKRNRSLREGHSPLTNSILANNQGKLREDCFDL